jgi:pyruvyltransferase
MSFLILCSPFTILFSAAHDIEAETPLFYWDAYPRLGFSNFGDDMSVSIVEKILGRSITTITTASPGKKNFLAIGTIVNYAEEGDILWGTGVNGKYSKRSDYHCFFSFGIVLHFTAL